MQFQTKFPNDVVAKNNSGTNLWSLINFISTWETKAMNSTYKLAIYINSLYISKIWK
jgi:hypothetical protein